MTIRGKFFRLSALIIVTLLATWFVPAAGAKAKANPPSPDATVVKQGKGTQTASVTTNGARLLLAFVGTDGNAGQTVTVSGGGLTWSLVKRENTQNGDAEVWKASASGALSNAAIKSTPVQSNFYQQLVVIPFASTNHVGGFVSANAASGAPSVTVTKQAADSLVYGVGEDWDHSTARTLASGQTMDAQYLTPSGDTQWLQHGTSATVADTAPTTDRWDFVGVEVIGKQSPIVTTGKASAVADTTATLNGTVNPNGVATTYHFEYGLDTNYGTNVPVPDGSAGSGITDVPESANITGLTPSTTYHYRLVATNGPGSTVGLDANFTTQAAQATETSLLANLTPAGSVANDPAATNLGIRFTATALNQITGVRFYKGSATVGSTHTVDLWGPDGSKLAEAVTSGETDTGWQSAHFATPVTLQGYKEYTVSYLAPQGNYYAQNNGWTADVSNQGLIAQASRNGVFKYSSTPGDPDSIYQATNYWVDLLFIPGPPPPPQAPTVTTTAASAVMNTTATFNGTVSANGQDTSYHFDYGPTTSYGSSVPVPDASAGNNPLPVTESTNVTGLTSGTGYHYRMVATNATGTTQGNDQSFTTGGTTGNDQTIFTNQPIVGSVDGDSTANNLGVKFVPTSSNQITGVRFYKGSTDVGNTHTVDLWDSTGQKLAEATTSSETASGWQSAHFSAPVAVTPYATYTVSYFAPQGRYFSQTNWWTTDVSNQGLTAPASVNGVFNQGATTPVQPTDSYHAGNYWVDPLFTVGTAAAPHAPIVTTDPASFVGQTSANLNGTVDPAGQSTTYHFEYGTTTSYGTNLPAPDASAGSGLVPATEVAVPKGLIAATLYHYRLVATNATGTTNGPDATFTTQSTIAQHTATGNFEFDSNGRIYDPDGKPFVPVGVNANGPNWVWGNPTIGESSKMAAWGFNTIRLNLCIDAGCASGATTYTTNNDLVSIVNEYTSHHYVVMIAQHEYTGGGTAASHFPQLTSWWQTTAAQFANNPYVWFNVQNEPTDGDLPTWNNITTTLSTAVRSVAPNNVITVDGDSYGQDKGGWACDQTDWPTRSAIINYGPQIKQQYGRVLFSFHAYGEWGGNESTCGPTQWDANMNAYLDRVQGLGLPIVAGELGSMVYKFQEPFYQGGSWNATHVDYRVLPARGIGALVWHGDSGSPFDLMAPVDYNWTDFIDPVQTPFTWEGQDLYNYAQQITADGL